MDETVENRGYISYKFHKLIMAIVLPPLLSSLLLAPFVALILGAGETDAIVVAFVFMILISTVIGWGVMIVIGLPVHILLCKMDKRTTKLYTLLGAVAGGITGFVFGLVMRGGELSEGLIVAVAFAVIGLFVGAVAAALFHTIRGPHRPLTASPNHPT
ncbi:MAG: hypothetical protein ABJG15_00675 [Hyphomonadaceae bacterium]